MTSNELEIFKQSILDDVRVMMQTTGQVTQYIGARYVPLFADPLEWSNTKEYEPLTIVLHQGNSFTSRQFVPKGVDISDDNFWANTGNYNAQIEQYRNEVSKLANTVTDLNKRVNGYQNIAELKKADGISAGDTVRTLGFNKAGDGGGTWYTISASGIPNDITTIPISNGLYANIIVKDSYYAEEFGMIEGVDCSSVMVKLASAFNKLPFIVFGNKTYEFKTALTITKPVNFIGYSGHSTAPSTVFNIGANIIFSNVSGCNVNNILFKCSNSEVVFDNVTLSTLNGCGFNSNYTPCDIRNLCAYLKFIDCEFSTSGENTNGVTIGEIIEHNLEYVYFTRCNFEGRAATNGTGINFKNGQFIYFDDCDIANWDNGISIKPTILSNNIFITNVSVANCANGLSAVSNEVSVYNLNVSGTINLKAKNAGNHGISLIGTDNAYIISFINVNLSNSGENIDFIGYTKYTSGDIRVSGVYGFNKDIGSIYSFTPYSLIRSYNEAINNTNTHDIVITNKSLIDYKPKVIVALQPNASFNWSVQNQKGGEMKVHIETSSTYTGYANVIVNF